MPYFEKALEYNPNSALVINFMSDFYASYLPNTQKYLEYALKGIQLDIAANDSITASFIYLHVSNAFIQSGFTAEAEKYINISLDYSPDNLYSQYVKAYILYAKDPNLAETKRLLIETFNKDTTRVDVLQEIGKICVVMRDYEAAYPYYKKLIEIREKYNLDIYRHQNANVGIVLIEMGDSTEGNKFLEDYRAFFESDESIYKNLSLAMYYAYRDNKQKAYEHLHLFLKEENYHYWTLLFLTIDPMVENIKDDTEFKNIVNELETKFWNNHEKIKIALEEEGLI